MVLRNLKRLIGCDTRVRWGAPVGVPGEAEEEALAWLSRAGPDQPSSSSSSHERLILLTVSLSVCLTLISRSACKGVNLTETKSTAAPEALDCSRGMNCAASMKKNMKRGGTFQASSSLLTSLIILMVLSCSWLVLLGLFGFGLLCFSLLVTW